MNIGLEAAAHWDLANVIAYNSWREGKLAQRPRRVFTPIDDLTNPSKPAVEQIIERCETQGYALYQTDQSTDLPAALRAFSHSLGLTQSESHRSQDNGVVALRVSSQRNQRGFIPYSKKPMNWHTDGYYNAPAQTVRSFVLHCAQPAQDGGRNQLIDPEIAYLRLRDQNPDFVGALMANDAMTIPANQESDGSIRPVSIGPVFRVENGALAMRYTARTRSIGWSVAAAPAAAALQAILESETAFLTEATLKGGQGIVSNNSLHNRTGFDANVNTSQRLIYRIRFHNRIES